MSIVTTAQSFFSFFGTMGTVSKRGVCAAATAFKASVIYHIYIIHSKYTYRCRHVYVFSSSLCCSMLSVLLLPPKEDGSAGRSMSHSVKIMPRWIRVTPSCV